jgi:hypothetical protein
MKALPMLVIWLLALSLRVAGQADSATADPTRAPEITHGTLVVAIASPSFIVVATDSRKTWIGGTAHEDNRKKLFRFGKKRVLAIAGLASAAVPEVAGLTEEIAPLLEDEIDYSAGPNSAAGMTAIDDQYWNDPPPHQFPPSWPEESRQKLLVLDDMPHYVWWVMAGGPEESIVNIAATYHPGLPLNGYRLEGLLAGFKDNGEAKLEHMVLIPEWDTTPWGLCRVGVAQMWERLRTKDKVIHRTMGVTTWADWVLDGEINAALTSLTRDYPAITVFLARRNSHTTDQMTEGEALAMAKELIRLTSTQSVLVGRDPVQTAVITPKHDAVVDQPTFPRPGNSLRFGTTRAGQMFTDDFPFDGERDTTYAWCEIKNNHVPIPLDTNYFYGNKFDHATFLYRGGAVHFGNNNSVAETTLIIEKGTDESGLSPEILRLFKNVERAPSQRR